MCRHGTKIGPARPKSIYKEPAKEVAEINSDSSEEIVEKDAPK